MSRTASLIQLCMKKSLNVLLSGYHGVGKTQMVVAETQRQGLAVKYFSASTLDPWADLVGIPVPVDVDGRKVLKYIRPVEVDDAEIVFFDELNRSHPKTQNAVLELIQFKSINGVKLPRLRMVWAAINPPDDVYQVTELDPALKDRFGVHLSVPAKPSVEYYRIDARLPAHVARALVTWWERDLNDELKRTISPRRLEYIGQNYVAGVGIERGIPHGVRAPWKNLQHRLEQPTPFGFELTRETMIAHQQEIIDVMRESAEVAMLIHERLFEWPDVIANCVPLFLGLPSELQGQLLIDAKIRQSLVNLSREAEKTGVAELRPLRDRLIAIGVMERNG
jgi:hypothetical protein